MLVSGSCTAILLASCRATVATAPPRPIQSQVFLNITTSYVLLSFFKTHRKISVEGILTVKLHICNFTQFIFMNESSPFPAQFAHRSRCTAPQGCIFGSRMKHLFRRFQFLKHKFLTEQFKCLTFFQA